MDDFRKPKIVWSDIGNTFMYDEKQFVSTNTTYLIASEDAPKLKYLVGILNSKVMLKYLDWTSAKLGEKGWRCFKQYVELFPIFPAKGAQSVFSRIVSLVERIMDAHGEERTVLEAEINRLVYKLYGLNEDEVDFIERTVAQ